MISSEINLLRETNFMTSHTGKWFFPHFQNLQGVGVIVIEDESPPVMRWPHGSDSKGYISFYMLTDENRNWSDSNWDTNLQSQLQKIGAPITDNVFAGVFGDQYACFVSLPQGGDLISLLEATKQMQETQMSFNLQYLQLQNQMESDNRQYTALAKILKTKHDTVKNSISNIR
jgi:hypothetical protein